MSNKGGANNHNQQHIQGGRPQMQGNQVLSHQLQYEQNQRIYHQQQYYKNPPQNMGIPPQQQYIGQNFYIPPAMIQQNQPPVVGYDQQPVQSQRSGRSDQNRGIPTPAVNQQVQYNQQIAQQQLLLQNQQDLQQQQYLNQNLHSNRSVTQHTQNTQYSQHTNRTHITHKSGKSQSTQNTGVNNSSSQHKRKKKKPSGQLPPPKVQIMQPNFNNRGSREHSNSYSSGNYQDDQINSSRADIQPHVPHQQSIQSQQPINPDSYRDQSYSYYQDPNMIPPQVANDSQQKIVSQQHQVQQPEHRQVAVEPPHQDPKNLTESSIDSQAARDLEFIERWNFAEATGDTRNQEESKLQQSNHSEATAKNSQVMQAPRAQQQPIDHQRSLVNQSAISNISSIRGDPHHQSVQQMNAPPQHYGQVIVGQRAGPYVQNSNLGNENILPQEVIAVQNEIRSQIVNEQQPHQNIENIDEREPLEGQPLSISQLGEMNAIDHMMNQDSEYSGSQEGSNRKKKKKKRGANQHSRGEKQQVIDRMQFAGDTSNRKSKGEKRKQQRKEKIRQQQRSGGSNRHSRRITNNSRGSQNDNQQNRQPNDHMRSRDSRDMDSDDDSYTSSRSYDETSSYSDEDSECDLYFHDVNDQDQANQQKGLQNNGLYGFGAPIPGIGSQGFSGYGVQVSYGSNSNERGSHLLPIQFAKDHIMKIEEDMKKMHERHVKLMREMDENYKLIEQETQEYYMEFLKKWKEVAKEKIQQYRKNTEELAQEKEKIIKEKDSLANQLDEFKIEALKEKENILKQQFEKILMRDNELVEQKIEFESKMKKKDGEIYNHISKNQKLEVQLTEIQAQYTSETQQLKSQLQQANAQISDLLNQNDQFQEQINLLQNQIESLQDEKQNEQRTSNTHISGIQDKFDLANTELAKKIQQLTEKDRSIQEYERQIDQLQQQIQAAQTQSSLASGNVSAAQGQAVQDQGQISCTTYSDQQQTQTSNTVKTNTANSLLKQFKTQPGKIRFATGDRAQNSATTNSNSGQQSNLLAQINNQQAKVNNIKFKGIGQAGVNKISVLKPTAIQPASSQNPGGIKKVVSRIQQPKMTEAELNQKKDQIINDFSVKMIELEDLLNHYNQSIESFIQMESKKQQNIQPIFDKDHPIKFDQKIKSKLEGELKQLKSQMEDEVTKVKKIYDMGQKQNLPRQQITVNRQIGNSSNLRNSSIASAQKGGNETNTSVSGTTDDPSDQNNKSNMRINLAKINQMKVENPYGNNNSSKLEKDMQPQGEAGNKSTIMKFNLKQTDKSGSNQTQGAGMIPMPVPQQKYASLNSAREPASSKKSSSQLQILDDRLVNELKEQLQKVNLENSQLKQQLSNNQGEFKGNTQLEKELREAKASLLDVSELYSQQQDKSRLLDQELKNVEQYQKENEDLKKQMLNKKQEYNKNIQYAKSKMDILKDQIEKLKQIVSQNRDEKTQLKGKIKSLESVTERLKQQLEEVQKQSRGEVTNLKNQNQDKVDQIERLWLKYQTETVLRKKLHNVIEDMKGKIRVYCRVRPMNPNEIRMGCIDAISIIDQFTLKIRVKKDQSMYKQSQSTFQQIGSQHSQSTNQYMEKEFMFDACFGSKTDQEEVFEDTKMLVQSAIDGYNVCIFAYGQTGSGKTYTVTGSPDNLGIVPRSFMEMFNIKHKLEKDNHFTVKFECYMVELYLDKLLDLLTSGQRNQKQSSINNVEKLDIREDPHTGMVYVQNAKQKTLNNFQEALDTFNLGLKSRKVQSTEMNDQSSRSHLIYSVVIECTNNNTGDISRGKISFVDLAGSERLNKSNPNVNIERLRESNAINLSLKSLGDVIQGLSQGTNKAHIPYRDNKLTHLMKDSLGGNSKTLMFVNISPADYNSQESQHSLQFGDRVKMIQNDVTKNVESEQLQQLKKENVQLKKQIGAL